MTKDELINVAYACGDVVCDRPFKDDLETTVLRHAGSRKWFGLVMHINGKTILNVKADPLDAVELREQFKGITPGYHMNKKHWISIDLDSDVPDSVVIMLMETSFTLTARKPMTRGVDFTGSIDADGPHPL